MRCTAVRPEVPGVWRSLGEALRENGELEESRHAIEYALELEPNRGPTLVALAWTQLLQEKFTEAEATARKAVSILPDSVGAHALVGRTVMKQGKSGEALVELERAAELLGERIHRMPVAEWLEECRQSLQPAGEGTEPSGQAPESSDD